MDRWSSPRLPEGMALVPGILQPALAAHTDAARVVRRGFHTYHNEGSNPDRMLDFFQRLRDNAIRKPQQAREILHGIERKFSSEDL